jgi:hypothetical protein
VEATAFHGVAQGGVGARHHGRLDRQRRREVDCVIASQGLLLGKIGSLPDEISGDLDEGEVAHEGLERSLGLPVLGGGEPTGPFSRRAARASTTSMDAEARTSALFQISSTRSEPSSSITSFSSVEVST